MSLVAFALRAKHEEDYGGGQLSYGPDGLAFDVKAALDAGGGKIVTDDQMLISALEQLDGGDGPLLKTTVVGDDPIIAVLPDGTDGTIEVGHDLNQSATAVEADDETTDEGEIEYNDLSTEELQDELGKRKIEYKKNANKSELAALLLDDDKKEANA